MPRSPTSFVLPSDGLHPSSYFALAFCILGLWIAYRRALPRPIPGIPCNEDAAKSFLGDVPAVRKHSLAKGTMFEWVMSQVTKLDSPIIQIFVRPFSKPWIVIADFRESQDILMRRTKEFDRGGNFADLFTGLTPDHHITMRSANPEFKAHRRLIQDLMTPSFLNDVSAPRIHDAFTSLIEVWAEKARLAKGHPFSAADDLYTAALDAIWAVTFPFDPKDSVINAQLNLLASTNSVDDVLSSNIDEPATFPEAHMPSTQKSILTLTESLAVMVTSPFPKLTHWLFRQLPYMKRARTVKEEMIRSELEKASARFESDSTEERSARCAMVDILYRELATAKKEKRPPVYNTRAIYDELFGLLVAGHDTTSTTAAWGLKLLSDHQSVQEKLRHAVRQGFPEAVSEDRWPTAEEISKVHIPYLDATREEIIRKSMTAAGVMREAMVDTTILGRTIPKGTNIVLLGNGPDYVLPPVGNIPEELRSEASRTAKGRIGSWDPQDCHQFRPERWLTEDDGAKVFDATAGPLLTFGLGPRGCFGRRMAYLELKVALVLLVWNLRLISVPEELNSYRGLEKLTRQPQQCYLRLEKL
ncbi:cytochrome P450 [Xylariaceae sp. FL1019]|nr:cytochrome P450 [Xylariaceae sp. FL1019]